jgi:hypothetical protein
VRQLRRVGSNPVRPCEPWVGPQQRCSSDVNFFKTARHAGVYYRTAKVQGWTFYDKTLGGLLSHGGRCLIQIPKLTHYDRNAHDFWDWFCGRSPIFKRQGTLVCPG